MVVNAQHHVVGLPQVALEGRPSAVDPPEMFENVQGLVTVPEFLVEFNEIIFKSLVLIIFFLELNAEGLEEGVGEVDPVPADDEFLNFEVNRKVVFDIEIQRLPIVVKQLKTPNCELWIHMDFYPQTALRQPLHQTICTLHRVIRRFLIFRALFSLKIEAKNMLRG